MLKQTSCLSFKKFGCVLKLLPDNIEDYNKSFHTFSNKVVDNFYLSETDTFVKLKSGVALLVILDNTTKTETVQSYVLNNTIKINQGIMFNFISISNESSVDIYSDYRLEKKFNLEKTYEYKEIVPHVHISKIYTKFYQEKPPQYMFKGEKHSFWELTYVDRGVLYTDINEDTFKLEQGDLLFYSPNQYHNQYTDENKSCCYLTVSFDMNFCDSKMLSNKVFHCDKDINGIVSSLIKELELNSTYSQELALCYIKQLILKLLQTNLNGTNIKTCQRINKSLDNSLLEDILYFIDDNIEKLITVPML